MASRSQVREALAYARDKEYVEGRHYSLSGLPGGASSFPEHRGHGGATYNGLSTRYLEFRCGCGEAIRALPPGPDSRDHPANPGVTVDFTYLPIGKLGNHDVMLERMGQSVLHGGEITIWHVELTRSPDGELFTAQHFVAIDGRPTRNRLRTSHEFSAEMAAKHTREELESILDEIGKAMHF